jgi:[ribosomal protein S5]-alanine N-acetyltransferase
MMYPNAFLIGERVFLRSLKLEDSEGDYLNWFNDHEVCRGNSHGVFPYTNEEIINYIKTSHKDNCHNLILAIISKKENFHIGNVALQNIHPIAHSAEVSIIIGEKAYWKKGFGKEVIWIICNHGFREMNLSRISCGTFETNIGMIEIARYIGMKEEGRRRNAAYKNGKYLDIIEFGILKEEYEKLWPSTQYCSI